MFAKIFQENKLLCLEQSFKIENCQNLKSQNFIPRKCNKWTMAKYAIRCLGIIKGKKMNMITIR